jgi:hypothetical protein
VQQQIKVVFKSNAKLQYLGVESLALG